MRKYDNLTIEEIINAELVTTRFQPIVSVKRKQVAGFEALGRGINPHDNSLLGPQILIREAESCGLSLDLDRLFRKKALETFSGFYNANRNMLLSVNLESSAIYEGFGSRNLINTVESCHIDPSSVIIEILESEVSDVSLLCRFVMEHRAMGFIIALDDFGAGFSNWDRIVTLRPDIIKLDRSIINGIDADFYKQEVARSIIRLAHNTGSLVIAEGIETHAEALKTLELNADMFQGFLFSPPVELYKFDTGSINNITEHISSEYIIERSARIRSFESETIQYNRIADMIAGKLAGSDPSSVDDVLQQVIAGEQAVECAYILDYAGIQFSRTVISHHAEKARSHIFQPDSAGCDQSSKDYYFSLSEGNERYITVPYISTATGSLCVTISGRYRDRSGAVCILCVDIKK